MSKIGIVTVLFNSASVLDDYFKSLSEQTFNDFTLYVVDNLSPDESLNKTNLLAENYKNSFNTVVIENDFNTGVARGNNIGLKMAIADGCKYVLLSNNDVVFKKDTIDLLINKLEFEKIDMIVPKLYFFDEPLLWYAGGKFKYFAGTTVQYGYLRKEEKKDNVYKLTEYAPTCFMLIKSEIFDDIGIFDENYFVYYDDTDWIYRCKKHKKKIGYFPNAMVWHKESTSTGGMKSDFYIKFNYRNQVYFCRKNFSKLHFIVVLLANFLHYFIRKYWKYDKHQRSLLINAYKDGFKMKLSS
ncbi:MAG: glycosyltransferase family 2 protein [Paludibacter sp.]|nr:glycosyltransferase family 2 protein [Paludibacter sp.]